LYRFYDILQESDRYKQGGLLMKAGPALRQLTSHRAIHDGAQDDAKSLTADMIQLYHAGEDKDALQTASMILQRWEQNSMDREDKHELQVARMLLKHWEENIIAHADTEDEGLFPDLLQKDETDQKGIHMMMRDHDLFRQIAASIKETLDQDNKVTQEMIYEFTSLIIINGLHHKGEEKYIFNHEA